MDNELKVASGQTATIAYECLFTDGEKKTITIGSYRVQDISNDLAENIKTFNVGSNTRPENFDVTFISPKSTAGNVIPFQKISGCTITVKNITVLI